MTDKTKTILGIVIGIVIAVVVFCLAVVIGCSINGLTFGNQIVKWFGCKMSFSSGLEALAINPVA